MVNDLRNSAYLPKNWRIMTAAGVATVGLACGLVQPALAELWKGGKTEKSATAVKGSRKTAPAENGFEATIRRLMADSRRTFDQGEHAKAIKLAERAVKISEAAVQVLGPMSECSPEETQRFLADLRARSDASAAALAGHTVPQPSPNQPNPVPVGGSTIAASATGLAVQSAPVQQPSAPPSSPPSAPPQIVAAPQPSDARPPVTSKAPARREAPPIVTQTSPPRTVAAPGWSMVDPSGPATAETSVPPSPAIPPKSAADFLTQSRRAAANGQLDQAIELAEQAVQMSMAPALFGPQTKPSSATEASRWLDSLVAQQRSTPKPSAERFDPPVKIAAKQKRPAAQPPAEVAKAREAETLPATHVEEFHEPEPAKSSASSTAKLEAQTLLAKARQLLPEGHLDEARQLAIEAERLKVTYDLFDDRPDLVLADVARAAKRGPISAGTPVSNASSLSMFQNDDPPATADVPTTKNVKPTTKKTVKPTNVNTAAVSKSAPTSTATHGTADESLWSEELPPAPNPELRKSRPPINFSRSTISRGWADDDAVESSPTSTDSRASVEAIPPTEAAKPPESNEAVPEFPIEHSTTQNGDSNTRVSTSEPAAPKPASAGNDIGFEIAIPVPPESTPVRPALRLRGKAQRTVADFEPSDSPSKAELAEITRPEVSEPVPVRPTVRVDSKVQHAVAVSETSKPVPSMEASTEVSKPAVWQSVPVGPPVRVRNKVQHAVAETETSEPVPPLAESVEVSNPPVSEPVPVRPPLRVRNKVQHAAAETESSEPVPPLAKSVEVSNPPVSESVPVRPPLRVRGKVEHAVAELETTKPVPSLTATVEVSNPPVSEFVPVRPPLRIRNRVPHAVDELETTEPVPSLAASVEVSNPSLSEPVSARPPLQTGSKVQQAVAVSESSEPIPSLAESVEVSNPVVWKSVPVRPPLRVRSKVQQAVAELETSEPVPSLETVEISNPSVSESAPIRPPLRVRSKVQQAFAASENSESTRSAESAGVPIPVTPIRLRGDIQQVAAEAPATELKSTGLAADFGDRPRATQSDAASNASPDVDVPVQRFPVQRVVQLRRRLESASALNPGASPTETSQSTSVGARQPTQTPVPEVPQIPAVAIEMATHQTGTTSQETTASREQSQVTGKRAPVKLRERPRLQAAASTANPSSPATGTTQAWMPTVGHSHVTVWKTIDATPAEKAPADDSNLSNAAQPISQARFESSSSFSSGLGQTDASKSANSIPLPDDLSGADVAPPPPNEPWFDDETRKEHKPSSEVVRKSSFATIDRLAEAFKLPVSTMMTLIGGGGLALMVGGLLAIRAVMRRRHSA